MKVLFAALTMLLTFSACEKEYSYEGGAAVPVNAATPSDSAGISPVTIVPVCDVCKTDPATDSTFWNLTFQDQVLCGSVTRAIISVDRTGFTFFGPSKCSRDTGLVISVALNLDTLNSDKVNILSTNVALEYYDNTTQTNFFESVRQSINFTIVQYDHGNALARGNFSGMVKLKNGSSSALLNGNFVIHFDR